MKTSRSEIVKPLHFTRPLQEPPAAPAVAVDLGLNDSEAHCKAVSVASAVRTRMSQRHRQTVHLAWASGLAAVCAKGLKLLQKLNLSFI